MCKFNFFFKIQIVSLCHSPFIKSMIVAGKANADAAAFKAAVQSAYPKYSGLNYLDMSAPSSAQASDPAKSSCSLRATKAASRLPLKNGLNPSHSAASRPASSGIRPTLPPELRWRLWRIGFRKIRILPCGKWFSTCSGTGIFRFIQRFWIFEKTLRFSYSSFSCFRSGRIFKITCTASCLFSSLSKMRTTVCASDFLMISIVVLSTFTVSGSSS